ncbi:META domain-containing protein [Limnobacter humi]|uniref:META domain-containing protein n=1 Tax=Limnobacter humi TaxID=1778671 RepID=A0ABT1WF55_9BURK|nr:META domain-containing protein [Limnobacter humi]MCQ8896141.1 META domain-containing protein [Limnobacter humi]
MKKTMNAAVACTVIALANTAFAQPAVSVEQTARPWALGALPATFQGDLPCASCQAIQYLVTFNPDHTYVLTYRYKGVEGPDTRSDLGRWSQAAFGPVIALRGQEERPLFFAVQTDGNLRLQDTEGRNILSPLNYSLKRLPQPESVRVRLHPLHGEFTVADDGAQFTECATGKTFRVASAGESDKLSAAWSNARAQGASTLVATVYGELVQGKGDVSALTVLRLDHVKAGSKCAMPKTPSQLQNQVWNLVKLGDQDIDAGKLPRAPQLLLQADGKRLSGSGGCNAILGSYQLDGQRLGLSTVASTRMACTSPNDVEGPFVQSLSEVRSWNILGNWLELYDEKGQMLARFESA